MDTMADTRFKKGQIPWNKQGTYILCIGCSSPVWCAPMQIKTGRKKFCSKPCMYVNGAKLRIYKNTFTKGHKIIKGAHTGHKHSEETKKIIGEKGMGRVPWNYKEDRSLLAKRQQRNDSAYKEWRKSVRDRDGWRCKIPNGDCLGQVVAHHILPWSKFPDLRYEINNGITLCRFHHPRKRGDEMKLSPYFQQLVISNRN